MISPVHWVAECGGRNQAAIPVPCCFFALGLSVNAGLVWFGIKMVILVKTIFKTSFDMLHSSTNAKLKAKRIYI
jgi:hypothetical protein